ncbi:PASTA domain-containing protein, partial [Streptomyces sp. NPDC049577]|uniref:PASTA domain-containing protein n=1 Tax=Streptomyces sp. NPDC049577 TaxID=3155153 RepID=UPI00343731B8
TAAGPAAGSTASAGAAAATSRPGPTTPPAPDYRGRRLDVAYAKATRAGYSVTQHDASKDRKAVTARSLWTVCFQQASSGTGARPALDFGVVHTGDPCPKKDGDPIPWPVMPELVWKTWPTARAQVVALGIPEGHVQARAAYRNDTLPDEGAYDDWRVCAHDPAEGRQVPRDTRVTLYLSSRDNGCPDPARATGAAVDLPDRDDDGDPDYRDPFPGDHDRNTAFPDGIPRGSDDSDGSGDSSGGSHRHGHSVCPHTRLC